MVHEYDVNLDVSPQPSIEGLEQLAQIATNTIEAKKINMRVRQNDLDELKEKAEQVGIGYQTILTLLIRQYCDGRDRVEAVKLPFQRKNW